MRTPIIRVLIDNAEVKKKKEKEKERKTFAVQYFTELVQLRKESLKSMTSAMSVQCFGYQLSYQANLDLVILLVRNIPEKDEGMCGSKQREIKLGAGHLEFL